tara:strand:+ start:24 stop:365 length:342 start_codon:yes stop_codon:yes gene_type:complete
MSKIKKEQFVPGKVRKVKKGNATITVISIMLNQMPINEQGWSNIGIQNRKNGTQFLFDYDSYIKDQKKPEELLLDILNEEYDNPNRDYQVEAYNENFSEDYELESRKHENWNK